MSEEEFGLSLRGAEEMLDEETIVGDVVLGVLDGRTAPSEWIRQVEYGNTLVLAVEGDLNERAAGFARDITEMGGSLTHFRGFLIVTPPDVAIDTDRLGD